MSNCPKCGGGRTWLGVLTCGTHVYEDGHISQSAECEVAELRKRLQQVEKERDDCRGVVQDSLYQPKTWRQERAELITERDALRTVAAAAQAYWAWITRGNPYRADMLIIAESTVDEERAQQWRSSHYDLTIDIGKALAALDKGVKP